MLIAALVLAVVGLAALVTAVVTSNELVAWVCIAASVIGVILLIVDAIRERQRTATEEVVVVEDDTEVTAAPGEAIDQTYQNFDAEYPEGDPVDETVVEEVDDGVDETPTDVEADEPHGEHKSTSS